MNSSIYHVFVFFFNRKIHIVSSFESSFVYKLCPVSPDLRMPKQLGPRDRCYRYYVLLCEK